MTLTEDDKRARLIRSVVAASKAAEETASQREAWYKVNTLVQTLSELVARDPDQEVQGIALPVLAAVVDLARESVADDPAVKAIGETLSSEYRISIETEEIIESGMPVRAADALVVARQLRTALRRFRPAGHTSLPD